MKALFVATLLVFCIPTIAASPVFNDNQMYPNSSLGDFFLNRCFMEYPPGFLTAMGEVITHRYINPRSVAAAIICIILVLPYIFFPNVKIGVKQTNGTSVETTKLFTRLKLALIHFLHRINYSVLLIVGLYCVFRQGRPCEFGNSKIGGYYGMPSGDAMGGGIIAAFIIGRKTSAIRIVIAIVIAGLVDVARVACGFHSIGMVLTGTAIGIALHYYSIYMPLYHIWIDTFVSTAGVIVSLAIDPSLVFGYNNTNNLWGWLAYGVGNQLFVCLMMARFVSNHGASWTKHSYAKLMDGFADGQSDEDNTPINDARAPLLSNKAVHVDMLFTLAAFAGCLVLQFLAVLIQVFDWIGIPGPAQNAGGPSPL